MIPFRTAARWAPSCSARSGRRWVARNGGDTMSARRHSTMTDRVAGEHRYLFQNYGRQPIVLERGEGTRVWDTDGNEYLDFVGGVAVNILGHSHPVVAEALAEQGATLIHTSNLFYTKPMIELAKLLVEHSCLDRVFFCNSGT